MNLTLLIPTKNRADFLIRLLAYYRDQGFQGQICIGDSSEAAVVEQTRRAIAGFQNKLNIVYKEYYDLNSATCLLRLLDHVVTPYAALLPDDDFLIPNGLQQCIAFLEEHSDYSAAHGVGALVQLQSDGAYGPVLGASYYRQPNNEEDAAPDRLLHHLSNYGVSLFSVHRTECWKLMYQGVDTLSDTTFAAELLPCCLSAVLGKIKELDCLYLVRQVHEQRYLLPDKYDWITSEGWLPSYQKFRDRLVEELTRQSEISVNAAGEVVKQAFWTYLAGALSQKWSDRYTSPRPGLRQASRRIPGIRTAWHTLRPLLQRKQGDLSLLRLLGASRYHRDFMPVYRALTGSPDEIDQPQPAMKQ
ncbi:MAG: TIGR00180 family glycosyltransferase [Dehalococcoidia bacterium]